MTEYEKQMLAEQKRNTDSRLAKAEIMASEAVKQTRLLQEIRFLLAFLERPPYQQGTATREELDSQAQPLPEDPQSWASELGMINLKGVAGPGSQAGSSGYSMDEWVRGARFVEARVNTRMAARVENAREGRDKAQADVARLTHESHNAKELGLAACEERDRVKSELVTARAANSCLLDQLQKCSRELALIRSKAKVKRAQKAKP